MVPSKLTSKEFEQLVLDQSAWYEEIKFAVIGRYGVQATVRPSHTTPGAMETQLIQSLPDFEGMYRCLEGESKGLPHTFRHVIFDAKVCSSASFPWNKYRAETRGPRARQLKHMLRRSRFGATCFFLFHWNERSLAKRTVPARTFIFPVSDQDDYWDRVESLEVKSLTLSDCEEKGVEVDWVLNSKQSRKYRPDFLLLKKLESMSQTAAHSGLFV
ncbi:hypothetical protein VN12_26830 [Pirellula sp. SH-Sr6A]|uniref:Holliday junction resolvase RecU n=1 Tax=Pirellula sp. SH-Sr6A TaxID=1632865 RepID=UPI00078CBCFA|nr:hypothetical protein VN12_26830 [Pirellula sp. SH-Sr6A]